MSMKHPTGKQISVKTQENLFIAVVQIHNWKRCTFEWDATGVNKKVVHLLAGQKKLEDMNKDPEMLPNPNKADMA